MQSMNLINLPITNKSILRFVEDEGASSRNIINYQASSFLAPAPNVTPLLMRQHSRSHISRHTSPARAAVVLWFES
jgi:hypothetical protein